MTRTALLSLLLATAPLAASAQSISLSPSVVLLRGQAGHGTTQRLTLTNGTTLDLAFELEAQDVVVDGGRRVFVRAGALPVSVAATAVFSERRVMVPSGGTRAVDLTVTLPAGVTHRAMVALFRGTTDVGGGRGPKATASLGTLLTFTLSDAVSLASGDLVVHPQSATSNLTFEQALANDGREPVVSKGVAVVLDARGSMVGKTAFGPQRLLPGERTIVRAPYAGELPPGAYRALTTIEFEGRTLTRSAEVVLR